MVLLMRSHLKEIQQKLGVIFRKPELLEQAFIHRSYLNEMKRIEIGNNERLEFLGDAVLELALRRFLYQQLPDVSEGKMTAIRSYMVSGKMLGSIAEELELDKFIFFSRGERKSFDNHERSRNVILAGVFEAVLAAMYLDRGPGVVDLFLGNCLFPKLREVISKQAYVDPKSLFQELSQEKWRITPSYKVILEKGPEHLRQFTMAACCGEKNVGYGIGASKLEAETEAARDALQKQFQVVL